MRNLQDKSLSCTENYRTSSLHYKNNLRLFGPNEQISDLCGFGMIRICQYRKIKTNKF